ncbi:1,4-dihydroxy-2-naphthoate polyprenyltransferase [Microbacterium sp. 18062]|uniref:1,4-dihydroxy-2-naphthoate polyprenyltransferase n=1 Tax=Microbacterium sp. 18062 TaxID=2681410 RepID=UPI001356FB99|nr:1,4-dihydroxy-2-naphthoate polyprenyltransferase [Microbacterium sp. 18062]
MAGKTKKRSRSGAQRPHPRGNPQKAHEPRDPRAQARATPGDWIGAARLRTLPLAITPVLIGTGAARLVDNELHWLLALGCLAVAVLLQIGVNYANDYSDGVRGTDDFRVGPARLTGAGKARPRTVLTVSLAFFALAGIAGLAMTVRTQQWHLIAIGAVCIVAAWFYTGGKRPYGYHALGEVFVFVFFGLVATIGTTWIQVQAVPQEAWFGAVAAGLFACAVLLANNLRDIEQDRQAGKRTLSVLIGKRATQVVFTLFVLVPFGISAFLAVFYPIAWLTLMALLLALPAVLIVWTFGRPKELVIALSLTSLASLAYGALLFWAFVG